MDEKLIWDFFLSKINNTYGVAGLMGNLYVESRLKSTYLQSSYAKNLGMTGEEYTKAVDNGSYKDFITDKAGYGLAQWTFWSRKEQLYNFAKEQKVSIGDLHMQLNFLWNELQGYKTVVDALCIATSVREASDVVATKYEKPEHQDEKYLLNRAKYGAVYYGIFAYMSESGDEIMKAEVIADDGKTVNFRSGPDPSRSILARIPLMTEIEVIDKGEEWSMASYEGKTGYIMTKFLKFKEEPASVEFIKVERKKLEEIYSMLGDILHA